MYRPYENIPSLLKQAGYVTGIIGKLHVEPQEAFEFDFMLGGFDYQSPGMYRNMMPFEVEALNEDFDTVYNRHDFTRYDLPVVADSAAAFIDRAGTAPFFLMVNYLDPHAPFYNQISGVPAHPLRTQQIEVPAFCHSGGDDLLAQATAYYNGISRLDAGFGLLMQMLEQKGLVKNTLIIFLGDHGAPLPRAKTTCYEAGIRIPLIVHFPHRAGHMVVSHLVSTTDILPTVLQAAGMSAIPEKVSGISWQALLSGKQRPRDYVGAEFIQHQKEDLFPQRAISAHLWKLIYSPFAGAYATALSSTTDLADDNEGLSRTRRKYVKYAASPEWALYDLAQDPYELINLSSFEQYAGQLQQMKQYLYEWQKQTEDPLLSNVYRQEIMSRIESLAEEYFP
jgi:N-sulfoglucosamine sulfohydrolase